MHKPEQEPKGPVQVAPVQAAPLGKRINGAMAAMQSAVDNVTFKARQACEDKDIISLLVEKLVEDVMKTRECRKKLRRLPEKMAFDIVRGLAFAWARLPDSFETAEDFIRALRKLRKELPAYLRHELEYGEVYNKKMLVEAGESKAVAASERAGSDDEEKEFESMTVRFDKVVRFYEPEDDREIEVKDAVKGGFEDVDMAGGLDV